MATIGELLLRISADSRGLTTGLGVAQRAISSFGAKSAAEGKAASGAFAGLGPAAAAAGIAVGAAAIKMATDFDTAFTRISALSNATTADIQKWKGEVLDLAGQTARAPNELADALFFLSSAGLKSGQVMDALTVSAKGAAVGLGSTTDVANIVASALNAYADAGLRAADVTDTLVAAVREGRAQPDEFANALGRILPIASQAGVSFGNVTASLAALSNIGLDVDEGVTAMRGAIQAIVAPGAQAANAMHSLGLSAQDLLNAISDRGLIGALRLLDERAKATTNTQADYIGVLRQIVPNVRALTGVLGLTGQEAAKVDAIFQRVTNSTGSLSDAFEKTRQSVSFQFRAALSQLEAVLIRIGQVALPLISAGLKFVNAGLKLLQPVITAVAGQAKLLFGILLGYTVLKVVAPILIGISSALEGLATAMVGFGVARNASVAVLGLADAFKVLGGTAAAITTGGFLSTVVAGLAAIAANAPIAAGAMVAFWESLQPKTELVTPRIEQTLGTMVEANGALAQASRLTQLRFADLGNQAIDLQRQLDNGAISQKDFAAGQQHLAAGLKVANAELRRAGVLYTVTVDDLAALARGHHIAALSVSENQAAIEALARSSLPELQRAFIEASDQRVIDQAFGQIGRIAEETGRTFRELSGDVQGAMSDVRKAIDQNKSPMEAWRKFAADQLSKASQAFASFRSDAAGNLDFVSQAFSDVASNFKGSSEKIAAALRQAFSKERSFFADLNAILRDGNAGSELLVQHLLALGPAGASAADAIANGSDKARAQIESVLRKSQSFADQAAGVLQRKLLGTMKDIRSFLSDLLKAFEVQIGVDINSDGIIGAQKETDRLRDKLAALSRGEHNITVDANMAPAYDAVGAFTRYVASHPAVFNVRAQVQSHSGGFIAHFGGVVHQMHSGGLRSDEVPAILQHGEFVVRRSAVAKIGVPALQAINRMHEGGPVPEGEQMTVSVKAGSKPRREEMRLRFDVGRLERFGRELDWREMSDGG